LRNDVLLKSLLFVITLQPELRFAKIPSGIRQLRIRQDRQPGTGRNGGDHFLPYFTEQGFNAHRGSAHSQRGPGPRLFISKQKQASPQPDISSPCNRLISRISKRSTRLSNGTARTRPTSTPSSAGPWRSREIMDYFSPDLNIRYPVSGVSGADSDHSISFLFSSSFEGR
jgi:hypothetical protein